MCQWAPLRHGPCLPIFCLPIGFSAFVVVTFVCALMTDEIKQMMRPDTLTFFSDYLTGGAVIVGFTAVLAGDADPRFN